MSLVYVYLTEPKRKAVRTEIIEEGMVMADYDAAGELIGIEVLDATGITVDSTLEREDNT